MKKGVGGIYFIKRSAVSKIETKSNEIEVLKDRIIDPFNSKGSNEELLKDFLVKRDINKLCQTNTLIYLETSNENYHRRVESINSKEVALL